MKRLILICLFLSGCAVYYPYTEPYPQPTYVTIRDSFNTNVYSPTTTYSPTTYTPPPKISYTTVNTPVSKREPEKAVKNQAKKPVKKGVQK